MLSLLPMYGAAAETSPLIRPRSEPRPPSPSRGKALQKASPFGRSCRPQAADEGRRCLYCPFTGVLREHRPSSGLGPSSATFPLAGEGSPQKASPFGRSCRPQAADEGRRCLYRPCTGLLRKHRPSSGPRPPSPRGGRLIYYPSKFQYSTAPDRLATHRVSARPGLMSLA